MEKDKLQFAKNYEKIKDKLRFRKKIMIDMGIAFIFPTIFIGIMAMSFPIILFLLVFEGLMYGTFAGYAHLCNRVDIDNCNKGCEKQFTYKEFKQMKKSGELENLYKQIKEMDKKEAEETYSQYLEFVKGKTYSPVKSSSVENNEEIETNKDEEINNNL